MKILFLACCLAMVAQFAVCEENALMLGIYERITLVNILPARETYTQGIIVNDIRDKVNMKQEELEKYGVVGQADGSVTWSEEGKDYEIEIVFSGAEARLLKGALKKMSDEKKIPTAKRFLEMYKMIETLK